jgi:hypothetical protein
MLSGLLNVRRSSANSNKSPTPPSYPDGNERVGDPLKTKSVYTELLSESTVIHCVYLTTKQKVVRQNTFRTFRHTIVNEHA